MSPSPVAEEGSLPFICRFGWVIPGTTASLLFTGVLAESWYFHCSDICVVAF